MVVMETEMPVKKVKKVKAEGELESAPKAKRVKFEKPSESPVKSPEKKKDKKKKTDKNKSKDGAAPDSKKQKLSDKIVAKKQDLKDKLGKKLNPNAEKVEQTPEQKAKLKEEKKKLREERRKKDKENGVFDIGVRAKQVWEEVRREDCAAGKILYQLFTYFLLSNFRLNHLFQTVRSNVG